MTPLFKTFLTLVALVVAIVLVLGSVGNMDYEDDVKQEQWYCTGVFKHVWPDYKDNYEKVCKKYESKVDDK